MEKTKEKAESTPPVVIEQKFTCGQYSDQKGHSKRTRFVADQIFGSEQNTFEVWEQLFRVQQLVD